jgi:hypothetical protein
MKAWNVVVVRNVPSPRFARFAWLVCGCCLGCSAPSGFELRLSVATREAIDQLAVTGDVDGEAAFAPTLLPAEARDLLQRTDETLEVIVDDDDAGDVVDLTLVGLRRGFARATGSAAVAVVRHRITVVDVRLGSENLEDQDD